MRRVPRRIDVKHVQEETATAPTRIGATDRPVPDQTVADVAAWIAEFRRRAGFAYVCGVAHRVVQAFFAGDLGEWRRRGPKSTSIRALAARLDTLDVMSPTTLYRYLAVYELVDRIGGVDALARVSPSHAYAVLPIADPRRQEELLRLAEAKSWSKRQLAAHVARELGSRPSSRGPSVSRMLTRVARDVDELLSRLEAGEELETRDRRETVFRKILRLREALDDAQSLAHPARDASRGRRTRVSRR